MRRSEKEVSPEETEKMLKNGQVLHLALSDGTMPYVVPMSYGFKNGDIFMHCAHEGRKIDIIKQNPEAAFSVVSDYELVKKEVSCGWTFRYTSVYGEGTLSFVTGDAEKRAALDAVMEHYGRFENEYPDKAVEKTCVLKLTVKYCTGKVSPAPAAE